MSRVISHSCNLPYTEKVTCTLKSSERHVFSEDSVNKSDIKLNVDDSNGIQRLPRSVFVSSCSLCKTGSGFLLIIQIN